MHYDPRGEMAFLINEEIVCSSSQPVDAVIELYTGLCLSECGRMTRCCSLAMNHFNSATTSFQPLSCEYAYLSFLFLHKYKRDIERVDKLNENTKLQLDLRNLVIDNIFKILDEETKRLSIFKSSFKPLEK